MNATVKSLAAEPLWMRQWLGFKILSRQWSMLLLVLAILLTSFAVVYVRDFHRRQFGEYQQMQHYFADMQIERGRLLLEQSTWATQARIQQLAEERLDMMVPAPNQIVIVK